MKKILYTTSLVFLPSSFKRWIYGGNIMLYRISVTERGLTGIANIFRSRLSRLDDLLGAGTVPLSNSSSFWASWRYVFGIWVLDFSPSHLQWAGHRIDPTWGQRYENPKYTIYRVLRQYCSLKVSKVWIKALLWERCQTWNKCDPTWPRELGHISLTKGHRGLNFSVYLENRNAAVQKISSTSNGVACS